MKSWKEEKLRGSAQGAKALREYAELDDGYKAVYDFAYGAFAIAREDVYDNFYGKYDPDTIKRAMIAAVSNALDFL